MKMSLRLRVTLLVCVLISMRLDSELAAGVSVAPGDEEQICRDLRATNAAPIPDYAPSMKPLMDSWNYQNFLPDRTGAVWAQVDNDTRNNNTVTTNWIQQSNNPCDQNVQVCGFSAGAQSNWLLTQAINRTVNGSLLSQARVLIEFELRNCDTTLNCQRTFNTHWYETSQVSDAARRRIERYRQVQRVSPDIATGARVNETVIVNFQTSQPLFYFAVEDEATCIVITRILVFYNICPSQTVDLISTPEIIAPATGVTDVEATCASNAETEDGDPPKLTCSPEGAWTAALGSSCRCSPGYGFVNETCSLCPIGTYSSRAGRDCSPCPNNSVSTMAGLRQCTCIEGYYRALTGEEDLPCSLPPAMLSECLARNITETEVTIQWRDPLHCGGRNDCYYLIKVNDGPPIRYTPTTINFRSYTLDSLQPDTRYRVTVSIHNGVSEQDAENAKSRECVIVATTIRESELIFGGTTYPNNTAVILEHIGEEAKNSLVCTSAHNGCCEADQQGKFYYPNGEPVLSLSQASSTGQSLYLIRNKGSISLKRQPGGVFPPLGRYRCEIPHSKGTSQNLFFTIGTIQEPGVVSTEYPGCPTQQPPLISIPDSTPTTTPDLHLGRYRCEIPGTLQNVYITISGTIQEPDYERPTAPDCPTKQLPVTSQPEATPESIPDIHFELNGVIFTNNSAVKLTDIGEGEGALLCKTDLLNCCRPPNRIGEFFYPSGRQVPIMSRGEGFYRNRGEQIIRLNRREGVTSPTGRFRCTIPDTSGEMKSVYITIN